MIPLAAWEEITGASGVAPRIAAMLPAGVRARQLSVRTLLAGMCPENTAPAPQNPHHHHSRHRAALARATTPARHEQRPRTHATRTPGTDSGSTPRTSHNAHKAADWQRNAHDSSADRSHTEMSDPT